MKEEILAGLRNAMERGTPLEQAVKSFINAGYNPKQVEEAAKHLTSGISEIVHAPGNNLHSNNPPATNTTLQKLKPLSTRTAPITFNTSKKAGSSTSIEEFGTKRKSNTLLIIMAIISVLIFLASVGYLIFVWLNTR